MYERIVLPTVVCGDETWRLKAREKRRLNDIDMKCSRRMCGVTVMDRIRNDVIREEVGVIRDLAGRVENCVLRGFGHVERMEGERMSKRIYDLGLEGGRGRGRPRRGWMDGVVSALRVRELTLGKARAMVHDRVEWRGLINGVLSDG